MSRQVFYTDGSPSREIEDDDLAEQVRQAAARQAVIEAERRTAIKSAEAIMHTMLGYLPDEPGDARIIRERIQDWLRRDAVADAAAAKLMSIDDRIAKLEAELSWYGEQTRLCRLIHSEGDAGRHALAADGGKRARQVLQK